ncbi:nickel pincer cofactor biosynthesis protein LarC [Candidatus Oleimmundimicrobium sp.]|uniref:nickel pincer cofactor biosynthesis protein LarC n=1 Tax=Candidatus Oleimmundimicrobium sp. TaxID=3060597 RepID=UPI0027288B34|nr:nickel pincer cofactor biosynthesis protein LarC [Candidatus Oleimmundimicrobium sp.]MDO8886818.1 nickel pincer cofactor biosynthesis protein LarC [Candidatus Oleimmundimicrobium sp.]
MKVAYFDCFSGISGDMTLGALLDAGLPFEVLENELKKLPLKNYSITAKKVEKAGIAATKVYVQAEEKGIIRYWSNVKNLIDDSKLDMTIKENGKKVFLTLAQAEAKIHKKKLNNVHFHEVGATDSIIDIVGTAIGLNYLKIEKVFASPVATGTGLTKTNHGIMPIPSPATLEILKDVPIYFGGENTELTTPTGASIIKTYTEHFGEIPPLRIISTGYGAGTRDLKRPNVLRVIIGEMISTHKEVEEDEVIVVDTNIDDMNPEFYGYIMEKLFNAGALDVWTTPVYMKKNRPGTTISALAPIQKEEAIMDIIFKETNTLGVRISKKVRRKALREIVIVKTKFGEAKVKVGKFKNEIVSVSPEYDDCALLAKEKGVAVKEVYDEIKKVAEKVLKNPT